MTSQAENLIDDAQRKTGKSGFRVASNLLTLGGVLAALAASSCCIVPLVLFALGISGAWIANLTQLALSQPYFPAAAAGCLGTGYWLVYRSRKTACADREACARPLPSRIVRIALVLASALVTGALAFDVLAPVIF